MSDIFRLFILLWGILITSELHAGHTDITVAADGTGDFKTLTEALRSLPMYNYQRTVIFLKKGVYHEKVLIDRDYLTITGESKDSTIIEFSQLRSDWEAKPDYIGPGVVNIAADDIMLENITIRNTQPLLNQHAFAVYGTGTRTILLNCNITSKGGDTLALWNYKNGMYYISDCYLEGGVDFVCPRGWCYIRDSRFYEISETAALWHAAVTNQNQKMVLENCSFDGIQNYFLARHHYEAQFYFLNCTFSQTMADKPIFFYSYPKEPEKNRPFFFGNRYYFYNSHRTGGDYPWHADNIREWPGKMEPSDINAKWTFDNAWDPENIIKPMVTGYAIKDSILFLTFNELLCVRGKLTLRSRSGKIFNFQQGHGRDILSFTFSDLPDKTEFEAPLLVLSGEIIPNTATVKERPLTMIQIE